MSDKAPSPRTFRDVAGWREDFREAAKRLDEVRANSLFDLPSVVCGQRVRDLTLTDWLILDQAGNPFVAGGTRTAAHASNLLWLLSPSFRFDSWFSRLLRRILIWRVLLWARFDEGKVIDAVEALVDDAFLDSPGRFSKRKSAGPSVTNWPRKSFAIELCSEIMSQFPSLTFDALRKMPLALFWQWLHEARAQDAYANKRDPYRNYQLTDAINTAAMAEFNRIKKREREESAATKPTA